jgi:glycosyltransferase involved in cell wall biosynthesis
MGPAGGRRLRVLRVIARMNVGGPALQVSNLAAGLDPACIEHRVLVGEVGPGEEDYLRLRAPSVEVKVVAGLGRAPKPLDDVRAWLSLVREMRRFRPDIVHTHTAKAGVLGRTAALVAGVPTMVHTFHGHLLHGYFPPAVTKAIVVVERVLARRTDVLVAVGARVRDELLAAGVGTHSSFEVVPPGVDLPAALDRTDARALLGLPADAPVIAYVCRLTAIKRPDRMVEVARRLAVEHPDAVVAVVGEGDVIDDVREMARTVPSVRFLGWRSDVENVYAAADLVLLTSDNEGMPVSLIEASACGRPSVATDVGSVREVVIDGETGVLCPPDAVALATAVAALLDDPAELDRLAAGARAISDRFTAARLVASYTAIYDGAHARRGRHPRWSTRWRPRAASAPQ